MMSAKQLKLREIADVMMGQSPDSIYYNANGDGVPFLQGCAQFGRAFPNTSIYCSVPTRIAPKGSILFSVRAPVGEINLADQDYCIGRGLAAVQARECDADFLFYLLLSVRPQLARVAQGSTFEAINSAELADCLVPDLGSRVEQSKIAEVLSTVDRAIEQTEALIAKHRRIKTGLMHDLLTRGIDEHGNLRDPATHRFKPSPVGMVPEEWEVLPLGSITSSAVDGPFGSNLKTNHYVESAGVRVVRLQNIGIGRFEDSDKAFISEEHAEQLARHDVRSGDLLIAALGDENHPIVRSCLYPKGHTIGIVKADCFRFRLVDTMASHGYVMAVLNSRIVRPQTDALRQGMTRNRVNLSKAKSVLVPLPMRTEQDTIIKVLHEQDDLLVSLESGLFKLQALKTGLMQDLLTSKVSVAPLLMV